MLFAVLARSATRRPVGSRPVWVTAMVGSELAGPLALVSLGLAYGVAVRDWAGGIAGGMAMWLFAASAVGYLLAVVRGLLGRPVMSAATREAAGGSGRMPFGFLGLIAPISRRPRSVRLEVHRYGPDDRHVMDVMERGRGSGRPVLVYVHGGGWWRGRRQTQALPMRHLLAHRGWVVCAPSYRLSPDATFPDHLVDIKRAVAWIREHAEELGVDPDFIAISGGSTGGNLAALAALTPGDRSLQPGFEDGDASVQFCVPLYGVHDMLKPSGEALWPYLVDTVMKSRPDEDPAAWRRASPARIATRARPPLLVVHGAADTLVPPVLSRRLVAALELSGGPPVEYLEVPWANHGFDFFAGPRGRMAAAVVSEVLDYGYANRPGP